MTEIGENKGAGYYIHSVIGTASWDICDLLLRRPTRQYFLICYEDGKPYMIHIDYDGNIKVHEFQEFFNSEPSDYMYRIIRAAAKVYVYKPNDDNSRIYPEYIRDIDVAEPYIYHSRTEGDIEMDTRTLKLVGGDDFVRERFPDPDDILLEPNYEMSMCKENYTLLNEGAEHAEEFICIRRSEVMNLPAE